MKKALVLAFFIVSSFFAYSLDAPNITSPENDSWDSGRVNIFWDSVSGATGYAFTLDSEPSTEIDSSYDCEDTLLASYARSDGSYYFHIASCNGNERSSTKHLKINIDGTPPSRVENLLVEPTEDGKLKISWSEAEDNFSGIASYTLYKNRLFNFELDDLSTKKIEGITGTEYIDSEVEERGYYNYKIAAVDKAGNRGIVTLISKGARVVGSCDFNVSLTIEKADGNLAVSASSEGMLYDINLLIKEPNAEASEVLHSDRNTEIFYSFSLSGKSEGLYEAFFRSTDKEGDFCLANASYFFDISKPSIKFTSPKNNATIDENTEIIFVINDQSTSSGIKKASLFLTKDKNSFELMPISSEGSTYTYMLNPAKYASGYYKLKAEAEDNAGNSSEASISIMLSNKASEQESVSAKISEAESLLSSLKSTATIAGLLGINTGEISLGIVEAEASIISAKENLEGSNYSSAKKDADSAISRLKGIQSMLSIKEYKKDNFSFSRAKLKDLLKEAGFKENTVPEADVYFSRHVPKRTLKLMEINSGDESYYAAVIEIEANALDLNSLFLYEVIPKEITTYFGGIFPGNAKIVSENPLVLKAEMQRSDSKFSATYAFSGKLSKAEADSALADKAIQKFSLPPLVYDSNSAYLSNEFSGSFDFSSLAFASFVLIALAILAVVAIYLYKNFFSKDRKKKVRLGL